MSSEFIHVVPRGFAAVVTKPITTSATKYRGELQGCPLFFLVVVCIQEVSAKVCVQSLSQAAGQDEHCASFWEYGR